MEYAVELRNPAEFTCEADYCRSNQLQDECGYGKWFESLEDAQSACVEHGAYGVFNDEGDDVWYNPNYKSQGIKNLRQFLGEKFLPKGDDYER